jgi:hypothetical protein
MVAIKKEAEKIVIGKISRYAIGCRNGQVECSMCTNKPGRSFIVEIGKRPAAKLLGRRWRDGNEPGWQAGGNLRHLPNQFDRVEPIVPRRDEPPGSLGDHSCSGQFCIGRSRRIGSHTIGERKSGECRRGRVAGRSSRLVPSRSDHIS